MSSFFCFRYRLKKLKWGEQISPSIQVVDLKLKLSGSATRHEILKSTASLGSLSVNNAQILFETLLQNDRENALYFLKLIKAKFSHLIEFCSVQILQLRYMLIEEEETTSSLLLSIENKLREQLCRADGSFLRKLIKELWTYGKKEIESGNLKIGLAGFKCIAEICNSELYKDLAGKAYRAISHCFLQLNDYEKALDYALAAKIKDRTYTEITDCLLYKIYLALDRIEEAEKCLRSVFSSTHSEKKNYLALCAYFSFQNRNPILTALALEKILDDVEALEACVILRCLVRLGLGIRPNEENWNCKLVTFFERAHDIIRNNKNDQEAWTHNTLWFCENCMIILSTELILYTWS
ncbi:uncharacterized protein LOC135144138 isoform X2 [Zophobas morio]|uniref:uncharacterized protein LOC135144138 isoform X2 n=1 Tax=Zophobas morio TaxID=2755281 RepID=UPI003082B1EA